MEKIRIAVITEDIEYGLALAVALTESQKRLTVEIFDKDDEDAAIDSGADLMLYDHPGERRKENAIELVEKESLVDNKKFKFYKYGNVRYLSADLIFAYGELTGREIVFPEEKGVAVYTFSSARGGSGCTSVAMGCAQELKRFRGERVIYISLEEIESTARYMCTEGGKGITEFLYYLLSGRERICSCIEDFVCADDYGVEAFRPGKGINPLRNLNEEEFMRFFNYILRCGRYDIVIFDAGNFLNEISIKAMDMSDKVCTVTTQREEGPLDEGEAWLLTNPGDIISEDQDEYTEKEYPDPREESYLRCLEYMGGKSIFEKIITVLNKYTERKNASSGKDAVIGYDRESFSSFRGLIHIAPDRIFGSGVKKLTDEIVVMK